MEAVLDKQDRKWVDRHLRAAHFMTIADHLMEKHFHPAVGAAPCMDECRYSVQELVSKFDFSDPRHNHFAYKRYYRDFPRLMVKFPGLDYDHYARMIVGYRGFYDIMTFFARTNYRLKPEFMEILKARGSGVYLSATEVQKWAVLPASVKSGMLNRWKKNPDLQPLIDYLTVAEVMHQ